MPKLNYKCACCGVPMVIKWGDYINPAWHLCMDGKSWECPTCQSDPHLHAASHPTPSEGIKP